LGFDLHDFWAWSVSDLVSNATRGRLAEYIIARALGISTADVRNEWAAYDLKTPSGTTVEVKSAAYLQAWFQRRASTITFRTPPSRAWNPKTNVLSRELKRQAEVYVFALLAHMEKATLDPLDVTQWVFFVVPTKDLDARTRSQHSITLKTLERLAVKVSFDGLPSAVETARQRQREGLAPS
jgi:hypothetical protein